MKSIAISVLVLCLGVTSEADGQGEGNNQASGFVFQLPGQNSGASEFQGFAYAASPLAPLIDANGPPGGQQIIMKPDGSKVYVVGATGIQSVDPAFATFRPLSSVFGNICAVSITPDGKYLLIGTADSCTSSGVSKLFILDTGSDAILTNTVSVPGAIAGFALSQDSTTAWMLTNASFSSTITAIDLPSRTGVASLSLPIGAAAYIGMSPAGMLYVGAVNAFVEVNPVTPDSSGCDQSFVQAPPLCVTPMGVLSMIYTPGGPIRFTPSGAFAYLINATPSIGGRSISQINLVTHAISDWPVLNSGAPPPVFTDLVVANETHLYALSAANTTLWEVNPSPLSATPGGVLAAAIPTNQVTAVAVSDELPSARYLYALIAQGSQNNLARVDLINNSESQTAAKLAGGQLQFAAVPPETGTAAFYTFNTTQTLPPGATSLPLIAFVLDTLGRPVYNFPVTFTESVADPILGLVIEGANQITNANGYVSAKATVPAMTMPGTYTITLTAGAATTEFVIVVPGTGSGGGMSQTISFGPLSDQALAAAPFPLSATASSKLAVTFVSNTTLVCTVSGVTVTVVSLGNCSITARQIGDSTYAPATPVTQTFTVLSVPMILPGGIVPAGSTVPTIQPGEWISIFGSGLAVSPATWSGIFTTSLGGTSVTINGKLAYLSYVSPAQINLQAPDDTAIGPVRVNVMNVYGTASSTVTLAKFAPSFLLLDSKHVAGIILRPDGSGAYGGGVYDIIGPTGNSLGYPTVSAKAGDNIELFAVGLGPTNPVVQAGQVFSNSAPSTSPVNILINNVSVTPAFAGLAGAGLYQINLTIPTGLGNGDLSLLAQVGGAQTPPTVVMSVGTVTTPAASLLLVSGSGQSALLNTQFGSPLVFQLKDSNNNPQAGATISFSVASGSATFKVVSASTDALGEVAINVTAGESAGLVTITATFGSLTASAMLTVLLPGPAVTASSFVNSASSQVGLVPCGLATVTGAGLAPGVVGVIPGNAGIGLLPYTIQGVNISVNAIPAPLLSLSNVNGVQQVNFQTPCEILTSANATVVVQVNSASTLVRNVPVFAAQPGIFTFAGPGGINYGPVTSVADGSIVEPSHLAHAGQSYYVVATGLGQTTPPAITNSLGTGAQVPVSQVVLSIDNFGVPVSSVQYQEGAIGQYVITFTIPATVNGQPFPTGTDFPISLGVVIPGGQTVFDTSPVALAGIQ